MIIDGHDVALDTNIKFHSRNGKDTKLIQGHVVSMCDYDIAKVYSDIVKYHQEVLESVTAGTVPTDPTTLKYFVIRDVQGNKNSYAVEWVEPTTLQIIADANNIILTVYDVPSSEGDTLVKLLRDNNYKALVTG